MSKKGKHSKKEKAKSKINHKHLKIGFFIRIMIAIGIIIYSHSTINKQEINKKAEEQKEEESLETSSLEESTTEEPIIEETVDTNIENLINQIMTENNLNENNFFFFYYNLEEKKYYLYNENTYFTAASTIKVPVAMLYYDKINEGELSSSNTLLYNSDDYEAGDGSIPHKYIPVPVISFQPRYGSQKDSSVICPLYGIYLHTRTRIRLYLPRTYIVSHQTFRTVVRAYPQTVTVQAESVYVVRYRGMPYRDIIPLVGKEMDKPPVLCPYPQGSVGIGDNLPYPLAEMFLV